jgi:hypothetical protein
VALSAGFDLVSSVRATPNLGLLLPDPEKLDEEKWGPSGACSPARTFQFQSLTSEISSAPPGIPSSSTPTTRRPVFQANVAYRWFLGLRLSDGLSDA